MTATNDDGAVAPVAAAPRATAVTASLHYDAAMLRLSLRRERRDRETERRNGSNSKNESTHLLLLRLKCTGRIRSMPVRSANYQRILAMSHSRITSSLRTNKTMQTFALHPAFVDKNP